MISVIIVGINQWEEYTRPLVAQLWNKEPDLDIVVIDNASKEPYPQADHIHRTERISYAEAINYGIENANGKTDWILSLNNDVKCHDKFTHIIEPLSREKIYGRQIIEEKGHTWLGNWLFLAHMDAINKVGLFDPLYEMCGFEDADYCVRAEALGIPTVAIDLPFEHLWGKTRWGLPNYEVVRKENMDYFAKKHGYRLGENVTVTHD